VEAIWWPICRERIGIKNKLDVRKDEQMKTIKWEKGIQGAIGHHPPKNGKMLLPGDKVEPNMQVSAKYKDLDVYLRIKEEINPNIFKASVMFFEPVLAKHPDDLSEGDEVLINRGDICCLFEKD
jgi:hypothetical protein